MIKAILKSIFCKHDYKRIRTFHGDRFQHFDARSEWRCKKCGRYSFSKYLDRLEH